MSLVGKIKKLPAQVISRTNYNDLLYLLLQTRTASLAVSAPLGAMAIYVNALQDKERKYSEHKLKNSF